MPYIIGAFVVLYLFVLLGLIIGYLVAACLTSI